MGITRRQLFGWMAAAGAGALAPGVAKAATGKHFSGYPESFGVLHDITHCIGCRKCEAACNEVNDLPAPDKPFDDLKVLQDKRQLNATAYTVVNRYQFESASGPLYVKTQCNHCLEPACASACFVKALRKDETGAVVYDASLCVGCRYCMIACPFQVPAYEYDKAFTPRVMKCTLCYPRIREGKLPGCVAACPKEALTFGKRDELIKEAQRRINRNPEKYVDHIYGQFEMGGTSWLYLSPRSFSSLGMREDLGDKAAPEYTSGALAVVPMAVTAGAVLLTGIYAIARRREQIAEDERQAAVAQTRAQAEEEMKQKLAEQKKAADKERESVVKREVEKALKEAEEQRAADKPAADDDSGKET
ncbi:MAG: 4Fe-4S dicluster domain-containing protein [Desulfobacteraceae bacterium]|nr:4Fe-4S dicluster domain-containing protein [Desulfobacteraceae bacterium]